MPQPKGSLASPSFGADPNDRSLRLLLIEDNPDDAALLVRELRRAGYQPISRRVDSHADLLQALDSDWDIILCDYQMPGLDAPRALAAIRGRHIETPCIIVSGTVGEEHAVAAMRSGAQDFIVKGNLTRLAPAIERELRDSEIRIRHARAQNALRATEESFRAAFELIPDGVLLHREGLVTHANGPAAVLLGAETPADLVGRAILDFFSFQDHQALQAQMRDLEPTKGASPLTDFTLVRLDGKLVHVELSATSVVFEEEPALLVVIRDVSARRELVARSMHVDRMLAVGTIAAGVGHEINNPLGYVMANVTYASEEVGRVAREVAALTDRAPAAGALAAALKEVVVILADVDEGARRIRDIARDLNTFARNDDELHLVDLRAVADSALRMAAAEVRQRARVVRQYAEVLPVRANASRMSQVILNLVINAAHAIPKGASESNTITVRVRPEKTNAVVEVCDTGSGIAPEHRAHLFAPFFTTKPVGQGTGLGLSISKRIVNSLGGEIEVESIVGQGTVMRVVLPTARDLLEADAPATIRPTRRGRLLLIDKERLVGAAFQRALSREHDVVLVESTAVALSRLRAGESFDVIFCDLTMPAMMGLEIYAQIERSLPQLRDRIVMIGGAVGAAETRAFMEKREIPILEKPLDMAHVRDLIARMLPRAPVEAS